VPEECPEELVELMHECMALEAHTRPTARELVERLLAMRHSAGS
jgi:hypothetical protein